MKFFKYVSFVTLLMLAIAGCKREQFTDTSFVTSATPVSNVSVMFNITHDNSGLVTITPNGTGAVKYSVYCGDGVLTPGIIPSGQSITHTYAEGNYQVKIIAYDIKGGSITITQPLVVSFLAPQNLATKVSTNNLAVSVSATAKYATLFKVYFGDSTNVSPIPFASILAGTTITHNYVNAGTYIVKVIALSGGAATTQHLDTVRVSKQINLPVSFEDANTNYTMSDFGGDVSSLSADPKSSANHVMKVVKTAGAQVWAGTTIGTGIGFASVIPLTAANLKMTVRVLSPAAGLLVKLKVDNHGNSNNGLSVESDVKTTVANQWETLTFDFSKPSSGTPAWSSANTYDLASIFFDFGNNGSGSIFYFDDLMMGPAALSQINLPATFDSPTVDYTVTDFGGNVSTLVADPTNGSNNVIKSIKTSGSQVWAGTTVGTNLGFSSLIAFTAVRTKMSVKVYSPAAGLHIRLKVEDHTDGTKSVETEAITTLANQWETLTFDFSNQAAGTSVINLAYHYDKASIFFDFGNAGTGSVFYWDSVTFL